MASRSPQVTRSHSLKPVRNCLISRMSILKISVPMPSRFMTTSSQLKLAVKRSQVYSKVCCKIKESGINFFQDSCLLSRSNQKNGQTAKSGDSLDISRLSAIIKNPSGQKLRDPDLNKLHRKRQRFPYQ